MIPSVKRESAMLTRAQSGRQAQCIAVRLQVRLASSISLLCARCDPLAAEHGAGRNKQGHRLQVYSNRRAVIGSMRLARWAGIMPAAAAIVHRSRTIVMAVRGSVP